MTEIKIMSLNVNGLNVVNKKERVMTKLKKEKAQVIFLQETHLSKTEHEKLKNYGYRNLYYSSYKEGRRRGAAILISNTIQFDYKKELKDKEGRYIMLKGRIENELITLVNVYAPPESNKNFFKNLFDLIAIETEGILICGGDLNVVLNHNVDTTSHKKTKMHLTKFINDSLEEMGMTDVWRSLHPLGKDFTHYSAAHGVHSRIDYFLTKEDDKHRVKECRIGAADVSDHNPIYLKICLSNRKRNTVWRLNVGILNSEQRREKIKAEIKQYIEENNNGTVDPIILWDAMKAVIRGKLIAETAHDKRIKLQTYRANTERLRKSEQEYQETKDPKVYQEIKVVKNKINEILQGEIEKRNTFLKQNYYETGSRAAKLLAKRIRKQQTLNTISKIRNPHTGELTEKPEEIEGIFREYYEKLYTQPEIALEEEMRTFLSELDLPTIGKLQNETLTATITIEEVKEAINTLKNNKSPGSDGYPAEWYKMFREELAPVLTASFNWTLNNNKIPPSWSEAIISVIPKQGKDKEQCGNYRPISLLNVDYKIYTTIISNRLNTFVTELIEEDQTGFMRGRQTHDNIRRVLHIVDQAQQKKQSTILVSVDAEKAFDLVNWEFLYKALEQFGFSNKSVQCIKTLYHHPTARIKINGSLTSKFNIQRSTRQGCCLSPTLFALFIEPLAQAIRQEDKIKGVLVNGEEHKIGLFADDVVTFLEQPNESLPVLMNLFGKYGYLSGYKINITKTQILTLNYIPSKEIQETFPIKWNMKEIKYLGIIITKGLATLYKANYDKIRQEIQKDIDRWTTLPLDLNSRIEIIKMNVQAKLLYLFQALPIEVPQTQFAIWDKLISRFIWGGKKPRVKYETLQLPKDKGGMGLPKLREYFCAAQLRHVICWCTPDYIAKWKDMEKEFGGYPIQSVIGDEDRYERIKKNMDPITVFTLDLWFKTLKKHKIKKEMKVLRWVAYDSDFKPAMYDKGFKQWISKGITGWFTLQKDGELESFQKMKDKYNLDKHEFYRYLQLRDYYRTEIKWDPSVEVNGVIEIVIKSFSGTKIKIISTLYQKLMMNKHSTKYVKEKWESELNMTITDEDWSDMWKTHQTSTNSRIWREFTWKNLIRFFITPKVKNRYKNTNTGCWRNCGSMNADHSHIFWNCPKIVQFWKDVHETVKKVLGYDIPMSSMVLYLCNFNNTKVRAKDKYLIKIMLIASKKAITRKWGKADPPCQEQWTGIIEEIYIMEKLTYRLRLQQTQMEEKWMKWTSFKTKDSDKN
uniref:Reverse transcriptase domain-containing protein n=1 Tax=Kryptolebias marmoratus TaxID=37003 RepID=A0A3Q3ASL9_KRYMA